jgi:polar amino acid transport system substrate-binding protein
MRRIVVVCLLLLAAGPSQAQEVIRLARIADIPDQ